MTVEQVQLRRGTAAQVAAFTGAAGELVVDTTNNRLSLADGATAGGILIPRLVDIALLNVRFKAVNLNLLGDTSATVLLPNGIATYYFNVVSVLNGSIATIGTAKVGLYTAASQGGTVIASQQLVSLTSNTPGAAGGVTQLTLNNGVSAFYNAVTLFLNVGTVQGSAATADVIAQLRLGAS
jgi:hypothetical protein